MTAGLGVALDQGLHDGVRGWVRVMFRAVETRRALLRAVVHEVPFLGEIDEVRRFVEDLETLARSGQPRVHRNVFTTDASIYLLCVMVTSAVLEGVIDRPRHLPSAEIEETLAQMIIALISSGSADPGTSPQ